MIPLGTLQQQTSGGGAASTLFDGMAHWFDFEEASGNRADEHDSLFELLQSGTVTQVAGKTSGYAAQFGVNDYLYELGMNVHSPRAGFTFACWVYFDNVTTRQVLACHGQTFSASATGNTWIITLEDTGILRFYVPQSSSWYSIDATTQGALSVDTWYFVLVQCTPDNYQASIEVNRGAMDDMVQQPVYANNPPGAAISFGRYSTLDLLGRVDKAVFMNRVLTTAEKNELYNSGSGIDYADLGTPPTVPTHYVRDIFKDTNNTAITSHTPDIDLEAGGWQVDQGTGQTTYYNSLRYSGSSQARRISIDAGQADSKAKVRMNFSTTTGYWELTGRGGGGVDWHDYWKLAITSNYTTTPDLVLFEVTNTSATQRDLVVIGSGESLYNQSLEVELESNGNDITGRISTRGVDYEVTYNSSLWNTQTFYGVYNFYTVYWNDFRVHAL